MNLKNLPLHFGLLNNEDRFTYERIASAIAAPSTRNKRNKRAEEFQEIIDALDTYVNYEDGDKWKRALVCGIFKFKNGIAVNISQLKKLVLKCKSSINGSFRAIGYPNVSSKANECSELLECIPFLKNNASELRQWTIRTRDDKNTDLNKESVFEDMSLVKTKFVVKDDKNGSDYITPPPVSFSERANDHFAFSYFNESQNEVELARNSPVPQRTSGSESDGWLNSHFGSDNDDFFNFY